MASSSLAPPPLVDEEMVMRIQQEDKIHAFLEGIGLKLMARREATQALTRVMKSNHEVATVEGKAVWRNKQVVIEATKMSFDRAQLHFAEVALYQEYKPEGENKILSFNPIALQVEEEDDGGIVELESPSNIRRTTRLDGQVLKLQIHPRDNFLIVIKHAA
nr:hypothetical protein CFP56_71864 [Quercus suber]